jgi:putative ABC transport system substrate-binding protein
LFVVCVEVVTMLSSGITQCLGADGGTCSRKLERTTYQARYRCSLASVVSILLIASAAAAKAQDKPIQIGVLALGPRYLPEWTCGQTTYQVAAAQPRKEAVPSYVLGLVDGLNKLNYIEHRPENADKRGRRFVLELRTGTLQQVRAAAREFAAKPVDFIVAVATATVKVAKEETKGRNIPILMTGVSDPVQYGVVESLARPGGYVTGVSHQLVQGSAKRVELFKQILPGLERLITIRTLGYTPSEKSMEQVREAADRFKIELLDWPAKSRADVQALMEKMQPDKASGLMILPDSLVIANLDLVIETSLARRVPVFGLFDYMAQWGALAASGPSANQAGSQVAGYIDRIVRGARAGEQPVVPVDPVTVVNLRTAKCLGITVPLDVLSQADQVIR